MNGLFNLPAPLFDVVDQALAATLPSGVRIALWAILASLCSMGLYWLVSPQGRIAKAKADALQARRALEAFSGELADAGPLIRTQFAAVFRQIGCVLPATLVAVVPVLSVLSWADARFSYTLPVSTESAERSTIVVDPPHYDASWALDGVPPRIVVSDREGADLLSIPMTHAIPVVERRRWWNHLFGNPLGYLPADGKVVGLNMELPAQRHQPFGPPWLGSWLAIFLPVMALTSLVVLRTAKIH